MQKKIKGKYCIARYLGLIIAISMLFSVSIPLAYSKGDFKVSIESDIVDVFIGEGEEIKMTIENNGKSGDFEIEVNFPEKLVYTLDSENRYKLDYNEKMSISLLVYGIAGYEGEHNGEIIVSKEGDSNGERIIIPVRVNVLEKTPNLMVEIDVPEIYSEVSSHGEFMFGYQIFNVGNLRNFDTGIYYALFDAFGNKLFEEHETAAIDTRASFIKKINLANLDLDSGNYSVVVRLEYGEKEVARDSESFRVAENTVTSAPLTGASVVEGNIDGEDNSGIITVLLGVIGLFVFLCLGLIVYILANKKINKR